MFTGWAATRLRQAREDPPSPRLLDKQVGSAAEEDQLWKVCLARVSVHSKGCQLGGRPLPVPPAPLGASDPGSPLCREIDREAGGGAGQPRAIGPVPHLCPHSRQARVSRPHWEGGNPWGLAAVPLPGECVHSQLGWGAAAASVPCSCQQDPLPAENRHPPGQPQSLSALACLCLTKNGWLVGCHAGQGAC